MDPDVTLYVDMLTRSVKGRISDLLNSETMTSLADRAFSYHATDATSQSFQAYYCATAGNREHFLSTPAFFRVFKQRYSLQGIDGNHLDQLESHKAEILHLVDEGKLAKLYFDYFADVPLHYGDRVVRKTLGSFFAKVVHTLKPDAYCALDNPIKDYLGLWRESFFIAFVVVSHAYSEWTLENPTLVQQMRAALESHMGKAYSTQMTDLKVLDLIFWHQANVS